jgi:hypothetical protein
VYGALFLDKLLTPPPVTQTVRLIQWTVMTEIRKITSLCILCNSRTPGYPEHVIPDFLGGRLVAPILCNVCNHGRGAELAATAKKDPSVRLAVESLQGRIPGFARKFLEGAEYEGRAADGSVVQASRRSNDLRILPSKGVEDSLILDTKEAETALAKKLRRSGKTEEEVADYTKRFADLGEDQLFTIPTGETFVKRPTPSLKPQLSGSLANDRLFALIALEFAALVLGDRVLRPSFDPAREYILGSESSEYFQVRQLLTRRPYDPTHTIMLREKDSRLALQVRLFGCLVGEVTFPTIIYSGIDPIYLEDLETPGSFYAPDLNHARNGQWIQLK